MRVSRSFRRALVASGAIVALLGGYWLAANDRCGEWPDQAPSMIAAGKASGPLFAGAARVALEPPYPVTVAGYGPPRSSASAARAPLQARAVVLRVNEVKIGIVALDVLLLPDALVAEMRARVAPLGLSEVWFLATHAHSSFGQYDARPAAALAGLGTFRPEVAKVLVEGAAAALGRALGTLAPARLEVGEGTAPELVRPRSGTEADARLTRVRVLAEERPLAQLVLFSAHPTLAPRRTELLDPDYPGALAQAREAEDGVTLFLPASVGNGTAVSDGTATPDLAPDAFAQRLAVALSRVPRELQSGTTELAFARVGVALPRPDASRAVGSVLRRVVDNFYCDALPRSAEVSAVRLAGLTWVAVPGEPTFGAARALEQATGAGRIVGMTNGYVGYIEAPDRLGRDEGEGRRQYYGPALHSILSGGAQLAVRRVPR